MASVIKQLNKQTGITYVYESESYWDKAKKQPRSRRKLIGKIDEKTGEIVPTGAKGTNQKGKLTDVPETASADVDLHALCMRQAEQLRQNEAVISALKKQVMELTLSVSECKMRLSKIGELTQL